MLHYMERPKARDISSSRQISLRLPRYTVVSRDILSLPEDSIGIRCFVSETLLPSIFANNSVALRILLTLWLTAAPKGAHAGGYKYL